MTSIRARLARDWYASTPTLTSALLLPLSWLFGGVAALRRAMYRARFLRSTRVPVPVIVVGNVTAGGAGKTPLVAALVTALIEQGRHPGIVSRGYGRTTLDTREVRDGDDPRDVGDEPLLLARCGAPVFVGRDRVDAARALLAAHPSVGVIISDDGLQHYGLARDIEIAVVDASRGFGNARLLPAGPLREPLSRLRAVDAIVWRTNGYAPPGGTGHPHEFVARYEPRAWINVSDPVREFDVSWFTEPRSVAIAGIANPDAFFAWLRAHGFAGTVHAFPDHHAYSRTDIAFEGAPAILMTEKDGVKCRAFADARMWMQPIRAQVETSLIDFVLERIDGPEASRNARLPGHEGSAVP